MQSDDDTDREVDASSGTTPTLSQQQAPTLQGVKRNALIKQWTDETARNREALSALSEEVRESKALMQEVVNLAQDKMDVLNSMDTSLMQLVQALSPTATRSPAGHIGGDTRPNPLAQPGSVTQTDSGAATVPTPPAPLNSGLNMEPLDGQDSHRSLHAPPMQPRCTPTSPPNHATGLPEAAMLTTSQEKKRNIHGKSYDNCGAQRIVGPYGSLPVPLHYRLTLTYSKIRWTRPPTSRKTSLQAFQR